jgi:predicted nucleic acid-binding protein
MPPAPLRLLDADVIIDVQRLHPAALAWYSSVSPATLAVPGYVVMELYQDALNKAQLRITDTLIGHLPIVWASETEASRALSLFRTLHLSHGIGLVDMLNAATALTHALPLCTFNVKHYRLVPALATEQPYTR